MFFWLKLFIFTCGGKLKPNSMISLSRNGHLFSKPKAEDIRSPICSKLGITNLKSKNPIAFIGSSNISKKGLIFFLIKSISSFLAVIFAKPIR